jgi:hypothetical protein
MFIKAMAEDLIRPQRGQMFIEFCIMGLIRPLRGRMCARVTFSNRVGRVAHCI